MFYESLIKNLELKSNTFYILNILMWFKITNHNSSFLNLFAALSRSIPESIKLLFFIFTESRAFKTFVLKEFLTYVLMFPIILKILSTSAVLWGKTKQYFAIFAKKKRNFFLNLFITMDFLNAKIRPLPFLKSNFRIISFETEQFHSSKISNQKFKCNSDTFLLFLKNYML